MTPRDKRLAAIEMLGTDIDEGPDPLRYRSDAYVFAYADAVRLDEWNPDQPRDEKGMFAGSDGWTSEGAILSGERAIGKLEGAESFVAMAKTIQGSKKLSDADKSQLLETLANQASGNDDLTYLANDFLIESAALMPGAPPSLPKDVKALEKTIKMADGDDPDEMASLTKQIADSKDLTLDQKLDLLSTLAAQTPDDDLADQIMDKANDLKNAAAAEKVAPAEKMTKAQEKEAFAAKGKEYDKALKDAIALSATDPKAAAVAFDKLMADAQASGHKGVEVTTAGWASAYPMTASAAEPAAKEEEASSPKEKLQKDVVKWQRLAENGDPVAAVNGLDKVIAEAQAAGLADVVNQASDLKASFVNSSADDFEDDDDDGPPDEFFTQDPSDALKSEVMTSEQVNEASKAITDQIGPLGSLYQTPEFNALSGKNQTKIADLIDYAQKASDPKAALEAKQQIAAIMALNGPMGAAEQAASNGPQVPWNKGMGGEDETTGLGGEEGAGDDVLEPIIQWEEGDDFAEADDAAPEKTNPPANGGKTPEHAVIAKEARDAAKAITLEAKKLRDQLKKDPTNAALAGKVQAAEKAAKAARSAARKAEKAKDAKEAAKHAAKAQEHKSKVVASMPDAKEAKAEPTAKPINQVLTSSVVKEINKLKEAAKQPHPPSWSKEKIAAKEAALAALEKHGDPKTAEDVKAAAAAFKAVAEQASKAGSYWGSAYKDLAGQVAEKDNPAALKSVYTGTPVKGYDADKAPSVSARPISSIKAEEMTAKTHDELRKAYTSTLEGDEKAAALSYSGSAYSGINGNLRKDGKPTKTVRDLDKAIAKAPAPRDMTVHRGMSSDTVFNDWKDLKPGDEIHDKAYVSTSAGDSAAFGGNVVMRITVPKGYPAAPIPSHHASEREFLLRRNTRYEVTKMERVKYGGSEKLIAHVTVIHDGKD